MVKEQMVTSRNIVKYLCVLFSFRFVLNELVQTEKDYVKDLGIVVEVS